MGTKLNVGDPAPEFEISTYDGKTISISQFRGKLIWLIFYRYPGCPICNLHTMFLRKMKAQLEENQVQVIGVYDAPAAKFPSGRWSNQDPPFFPVIADPAKSLYKLYGTDDSALALLHPQVAVDFVKAIGSGIHQGEFTGHLGTIPAHFLIDKNGILQKVHYGRHVADHVPWSEVKKFIS